MNTGNLFILSAPSGAGKTTVLKKVMAEIGQLKFSVSHTTRHPRKGEVHGRDYFFVTTLEFQDMRDNGEFLEWAEVHGNFYGTSQMAVQDLLDEGCDVILDIDVQGAAIIRDNKNVEAHSVFIVPPSFEELASRLQGRATDSPETIALRLLNAEKEMLAASDYEYMVVNDTVEEASLVLSSIIIAARARGNRRLSGAEITSWQE